MSLSILTRLVLRFSLSASLLYLLAGLAFGKWRLVPLRFSEHFIHGGAARNPCAYASKRPAKAGRNAPCSCGSGKKFKKCHVQ